MSTKIIGINGFKRSGKGETGAAIVSVAADKALHAHTLGFADKLKVLAAKTLGFLDRSDEECIALMDEAKEKWIFDITANTPESLICGPSEFWPDAKHNLTGRVFLQNLGTQARKVFGDDFWVDQVLPRPQHLGYKDTYRKLVGAQYDANIVAFTDLRFENEAERILALGGEVWEVLRPDTESDGHDSEQVLPRDLISRQIDNSGSLNDLRYNVERALSL
jgi:hypothetical protein